MSGRTKMPKPPAAGAAGAEEHGDCEVGQFRSRHLSLARKKIATERGPVSVTINQAESPLAWLSRRRGRDGRALIEPHQLLAGERLRADFTRAQLMPRTTSNWESPIASGRRGGGAGNNTDTMIASRQRVHRALDAVGPEFAGLLVDVCCFLQSLDGIERERLWPARSGKVVLQLALDRLARHYGFAAEARGRGRPQVRTWLAAGMEFGVEETEAEPL